MRKVIVAAFFFWLSCAWCAHADDSGQALLAAKQMQKLISENQLNVLWDRNVSEFFKSRVSKNVFFANLSQGRVSVGGPALASEVVDVTYFTQDPNSGYKGDIYNCRFLTKYPAGNFYENMVLIKEADGQFRLSGLNAAPAPPSPSPSRSP